MSYNDCLYKFLDLSTETPESQHFFGHQLLSTRNPFRFVEAKYHGLHDWSSGTLGLGVGAEMLSPRTNGSHGQVTKQDHVTSSKWSPSRLNSKYISKYFVIVYFILLFSIFFLFQFSFLPRCWKRSAGAAPGETNLRHWDVCLASAATLPMPWAP